MQIPAPQEVQENLVVAFVLESFLWGKCLASHFVFDLPTMRECIMVAELHC